MTKERITVMGVLLLFYFIGMLDGKAIESNLILLFAALLAIGFAFLFTSGMKVVPPPDTPQDVTVDFGDSHIPKTAGALATVTQLTARQERRLSAVPA